MWEDIDQQFFETESEIEGVSAEQMEAALHPTLGINDNEDADSFVSTHETIENIRHDRKDRIDSVTRAK